MPSDEPETGYLLRLKTQVDRVVEAYRVNVDDLREAHTWLRGIADCLRYPPSDFTPEPSLTGEQVKQEMEALLQSFQPDLKRKPAQAALHGAWHRTWEEYGPDPLHCYDIPGLPPDNLMLESLFGRLRRHQRRVSGRKSTLRLLYRLHRDPLGTVRGLVKQHAARRAVLAAASGLPPPTGDN